MSGGKDSAIEVVSRVVAAAAPIHLMQMTKEEKNFTGPFKEDTSQC